MYNTRHGNANINSGDIIKYLMQLNVSFNVHLRWTSDIWMRFFNIVYNGVASAFIHMYIHRHID